MLHVVKHQQQRFTDGVVFLEHALHDLDAVRSPQLSVFDRPAQTSAELQVQLCQLVQHAY